MESNPGFFWGGLQKKRPQNPRAPGFGELAPRVFLGEKFFFTIGQKGPGQTPKFSRGVKPRGFQRGVSIGREKRGPGVDSLDGGVKG